MIFNIKINIIKLVRSYSDIIQTYKLYAIFVCFYDISKLKVKFKLKDFIREKWYFFKYRLINLYNISILEIVYTALVVWYILYYYVVLKSNSTIL